MKKVIVLIVKATITVLVLGWIAVKTPLHEAAGLLPQTNLFWLLSAFAMISVMMVGQAFRWKVLLKTIDTVVTPEFFTLFRFIGIGYFANIFLPSTIGGDVTKSIGLGREIGNIQKSVTSVLVARLCGVSSLLGIFWLMYTIQSSLLTNYPWVLTAMVIMSVVCIVAFALILAGPSVKFFRTNRWSLVRNFWEAVREYHGRPVILFRALLWSILIQGANVMMLYALARSVSMPLSASVAGLFYPVIIIINFLPLGFYNLGVKEGLAIFFLTTLSGITREQCLAAGVLSYVVVLLPVGIGAFFFLRGKKRFFIKNKVL